MKSCSNFSRSAKYENIPVRWSTSTRAEHCVQIAKPYDYNGKSHHVCQCMFLILPRQTKILIGFSAAEKFLCNVKGRGCIGSHVFIRLWNADFRFQYQIIYGFHLKL